MKNRAFDHSKYANWIDPHEVIPYGKNAKVHDDKQVRNIANSIRRFGWQQDTVMTSDRVLIIGHGRRLAALQLGCEMPYHVIDKTADELTEEDIKELRIADNMTNESAWDWELLQDDAEGLEFEGFDFEFTEEPEEIGPVEEDDYEIELPEEPVAKRGYIYQLGQHRIMCGDSTSREDVALLLGGEAVDLGLTDPPYNMAYQGAGNTRDRASKKIMNDNMPVAEFRKFLTAMYKNYSEVLKDGASLYVFYKEMGEGVFIQAMADGGITYKQELIWLKDHLVLGGSKYQSIYEPFLMGCKGGSIGVWNGGRKQRSVIESLDFMDDEELRDTIRELMAQLNPDVIREQKQRKNDLHPTMKPIRLLAKLIENSSNMGDSVLDLFGGSGSTLIAAQQTNRRAYCMELDPKYVDVMVDRWEKFTGETAILISGE